MTNIENVEPSPAMAQVTCGIASSSGDATSLSIKLQPGGQSADQDASLTRATSQSASATTLVIELTCPVTSPHWVEEERWCILVVTTSVQSLNLETTSAILGDTVTTSVEGRTFQNPHMVAALSGSAQGRRAISDQGATLKELGKKI